MSSWSAATNRNGLVPAKLQSYRVDLVDTGAAMTVLPLHTQQCSTKETLVVLPRTLWLVLGVWNLCYLARQLLSLKTTEAPFSPLGSFALEGALLAVSTFAFVLGWSIVTITLLATNEQPEPVTIHEGEKSGRAQPHVQEPIGILFGANSWYRHQGDQRHPMGGAIPDFHQGSRTPPFTLKEMPFNNLDDLGHPTR